MSTKGEFRVGIDFNPSGDDLVNRIKRAAADLIDLVDEIAATDSERERLKALAQTEIESAAMWAVKAATKKPRPSAFDPAVDRRNAGDDIFDGIVRSVIEKVDDRFPRDRIDAVHKLLSARGFQPVADRDIAAAIARLQG